MKREGISTLFIHGSPWALSYSLRSLAFILLCACGVGFESIFKNLFVMVLVSIRTYTKFCFEKVVQRCVCESCFEKCFEEMFCNGSRLYKNIYKTFCFFEKFWNKSVGVKVFVVSKRVTKSESIYSKGLKLFFYSSF